MSTIAVRMFALRLEMVMTVLAGLRSSVGCCKGVSVPVDLTSDVDTIGMSFDTAGALAGARQADPAAGAHEVEAAAGAFSPLSINGGNENGPVSELVELRMGWQSSRKLSPELPNMSVFHVFPLLALVEGSQRTSSYAPSNRSKQLASS